MVGFSPRRVPRRKPRPEKGRVVALYGAPGAGTSTIADVLCKASNKNVEIVRRDDGEALATSIEAARLRDADVVLIDAVYTPDDLKELVEEGYIDGHSHGCVVLVQNMNEEAQYEGVIRAEWNQRRSLIEQTIQLYLLPHFTVQNVLDNLVASVGHLAKIAQLKS